MNCTTFHALAHELIEGVLTAPQAEVARAHAAGCTACSAHLESTERFATLLAGSGDEAIDAWTAHVASERAAAGDPAAAAVTRDAARSVRAAPRRIGVLTAAAAAVALVAAVTWSLLRGPEVLAEAQPTTLTRGMHVLAADGRELEAEDSAQVVVPRGTEGSRVRLDAGTVLFRVEPGRSFAVETPQGTANALGTSFHIAVAPNREVSVTVHSGRVRFAGGRETTLLGEGDRLEVDAQGVQRLINRRRIEDLQTDLTAFRESAARARRDPDDSGPARAAPSQPAPAAPVFSADAARTYFESEDGRKLLAAAIRSVQDAQMAQGAARMADGMISRLAKEADLTEDQVKRLREIFRHSGAEFRDAWAALSTIAADASETDRDRVRHEVAEKSAEIERRKDDDVKLLLSQTQYETYTKQFHDPASRFGGAKDRGN